MISSVRLIPDAVYDDGSLQMELGLTLSSVARARREGKLRFTLKGKRIFYLGQWVLDWLAADAQLTGKVPP